MKARKLRELIGNEWLEGYIIQDGGDTIEIGNSYVSGLITLDKKTLQIKYAFAVPKSEESNIESVKDKPALYLIWEALASLIREGKIQDIIEGNDEPEELEETVTTYTFQGGRIIEEEAFAFGWPNVTLSGKLQYENSHFKTKREAIEAGIRETEAEAKHWKEMYKHYHAELNKAIIEAATAEVVLIYLKSKLEEND